MVDDRENLDADDKKEDSFEFDSAGESIEYISLDQARVLAMRTARDATLAAPRLLLPSIQVNIRAGKFPPAEANGVRYLTIPVKLKGGAELGV